MNIYEIIQSILLKMPPYKPVDITIFASLSKSIFLVPLGSSITFWAIQPESCSNPHTMQRVF